MINRSIYHDYFRNRRVEKMRDSMDSADADYIDMRDWYLSDKPNHLLRKARKINATGYRRLNIKASRELLLRLELDFTEESLKW